MAFRSDQLRTIVYLVKRSVGKYRKAKHKKNGADLVYWRGQLAKDWHVWIREMPDGEPHIQQFNYCKGRLIWLDAELFNKIQNPATDYWLEPLTKK